MASYRIVCTKQVPVTEPTTHAHIVEIGYTDDFSSSIGKYRKTLTEIIKAMDKDIFYTFENGHKALVKPYACSFCDRMHIRTVADQYQDNNLDSLRSCSWAI